MKIRGNDEKPKRRHGITGSANLGERADVTGLHVHHMPLRTGEVQEFLVSRGTAVSIEFVDDEQR